MLFEVLFGQEASIQNNDSWYFAKLAISHYNKGTLDEMIPLRLRQQMNLQALKIFSDAAYCCLKENRPERPDMHQIRSSLERALKIQHKYEKSTASLDTARHLKKDKGNIQISLNAIISGTQNFSDSNLIGEGRFWKLYRVEVAHDNGCTSLIAQRLYSKKGLTGDEFKKELETLLELNHKNIIIPVGYCDEMNEKIIVYEHASYNARLGKHLDNPSLTWKRRLKICIDVAKGLKYLHEGFSRVVYYRNTKSNSILLDDDWNAKLFTAELLEFHWGRYDDYYDDYTSYGVPKLQLGAILIEMLCGTLASHGRDDHSQSLLGPLAKRIYSNETRNLDEMIFEGLKGQIGSQSLTIFLEIVIKCSMQQPMNLGEVVLQLEKALEFQDDYETRGPRLHIDYNEIIRTSNIQEIYDILSKEKHKVSLQISLNAIKLGTHNFSDSNCIGEGRFCKLYEGEVANGDRCTTFIAKRLDRKCGWLKRHFWSEVEHLMYNHENIFGLVGYCDEMNEFIIVYENVSNGRLSNHLDNPFLTWMKRLKICIDVAKGMEFLLRVDLQNVYWMIDEDIKSSNILLDGDWNAKIHIYELFSIRTGIAFKSWGSVRPKHRFDRYLEEYSIYSLGVILVEMLCGSLTQAERNDDHSQSLGDLAVRHYRKKGNLDEMIFKGIKEQVAPQSLTTFQTIAIKCLQWKLSMKEVVKELEDLYEIWKPKLSNEIIETSKIPEIYDSTEMQEDMCDIFSTTFLECRVNRPRESNLTRKRKEIEISEETSGTLKINDENFVEKKISSDEHNSKKRNNEAKKIEDYTSAIERNYSIIVDRKKDVESSLKEALTMFPENENLNEWKQKMEELFGRT